MAKSFKQLAEAIDADPVRRARVEEYRREIREALARQAMAQEALREILVALVADSLADGLTPCHAESGYCFWCSADQWHMGTHSADCPWRRALEVVNEMLDTEGRWGA